MVNITQPSSKTIAIITLVTGAAIAGWVLIWGDYLAFDLHPGVTKARDIHPFMTGLVVPLLTIGSALLVYENLRNTSRQNFSNNFLKLIEMHHKLRDNISEDIWQNDGQSIVHQYRKCSGKIFFDD